MSETVDSLNRFDGFIGTQRVTIYPFDRRRGKEHEYALTIDVSELDDVMKPQAKVNFVVDNKIVKQVTIQEMIQGFFSS